MLRRFNLVIFLFATSCAFLGMQIEIRRFCIFAGRTSKAIARSFSMFPECLFDNDREKQMIEKGEKEI